MNAWTADIGGSRGVALRHRRARAASARSPASSGGRRALVVTDPGVRAAGHVERALAVAGEAPGSPPRCSTASRRTRPSLNVEAGRSRAADFGADLLVGLGGGSAMDCAKGINFLLTNGGRMEDYWGSGKACAADAAVDRRAHDGRHRQRGAVLRPDLRIPDDPREDGLRRPEGALPRGASSIPSSRATAPPRGSRPRPASTPSRTPSRATSRRAATRSPACSRARPGACSTARLETALSTRAEDLTRRSGDMLLGAHLAGAAIEASMLGAAHACANPLTARFGIVHGVAVGLMLPARGALQRARPATASSTASSAASGPRSWRRRIEALRAAAGLPGRLRRLWRRRRGACPSSPKRRRTQWTGVVQPAAGPTRRRCWRCTRRPCEARCRFSCFCCLVLAAASPAPEPSLDDVPRRRRRSPAAPRASCRPQLEPLWTFEAGTAISSTAAIADGMVYVGSLDGHLYALDLATGKPALEATRRRTRSSPRPRCATASSTSATRRGTFHAVDAKTGARRWTFETGGRRSPPRPTSPPGACVFGSYDKFLYCLSPQGRQAGLEGRDRGLRPRHAGDRRRTVISPAATASCALCAPRTARRCGKVALGGYVGREPRGLRRPRLRRHLREPGAGRRPRSAAPSLWRYEHPVRKFPFYSSPAVADEGRRRRRPRQAGPRARRRDRQGAAGPRDPLGVDASPVIAGERVFAAAKSGEVFALDLATGKRSGASRPARRVDASPASRAGRLVIGDHRRHLYCFGAQMTTMQPQPEPSTAEPATPSRHDDRGRQRLRLQLPAVLVLEPENLPQVARRARRAAAPRHAARALPAHPVLPQALQVLLLPRLHRQEHRGDRRLPRRPGAEVELLRRAAGDRRPAAASSSTSAAARRPTSASASSKRSSRACRRRMPWDGAEEVTFECEPGTLTRSKLEAHPRASASPACRSASRASTTTSCARTAAPTSSTEIYRVLPWIRELGFPQLNIDLIAGMVGRDLGDLARDGRARRSRSSPTASPSTRWSCRTTPSTRRACCDGDASASRLADWDDQARVARLRHRASSQAAGYERLARLHHGEAQGQPRRASSTATRSGTAATWWAPASPRSRTSSGVHFQNVDALGRVPRRAGARAACRWGAASRPPTASA